MKTTKYEREVLKYLLYNMKAKSSYEIAKSFKNLNNKSFYNKALNKLLIGGEVIKNKESYWVMNNNKYDYITDPNIAILFKANSELLDKVIGNKKYTFREWLNEIFKMGKDMQGLSPNFDLNKKVISSTKKHFYKTK